MNEFFLEDFKSYNQEYREILHCLDSSSKIQIGDHVTLQVVKKNKSEVYNISVIVIETKKNNFIGEIQYIKEKPDYIPSKIEFNLDNATKYLQKVLPSKYEKESLAKASR